MWTPTNKALPVKSGWYLVTIEPTLKGAKIRIAVQNYHKGQWIGCYDNITAWMPCPEPYKSQKGENYKQEIEVHTDGN